MKAIVFPQYGSPDVLRLQEVDMPALGEGQVLVKVRAASINALDSHTVRSDPLWMRAAMGNGLRVPKNQRVGADLAGVVHAVGPGVTRFKPGDEVFGSGDGAFAEYAVAKQQMLASKPSTVTFETAAALPVAALTALQALRDAARLQRGEQVLIQGASGGVGGFAVQIAKAMGADVTGVCSTRNVAMVRSIGADRVIDYTQEDFTRAGRQYDLILAINGFLPLASYRRALKPEGRFVMVGGSKPQLLRAMFESMVLGALLSKAGRQRLGNMGVAKVNQQDLTFIGELVESGKVTPFIDRCYPLEKTADALRYVEDVHAQGKVVVVVA